MPKKIFHECYRIIENFLYTGHWYCLCDLYEGCQTEMNFIMNTKGYCCICQFDFNFNTDELHKVKHDTAKLRSYYNEILKVICEAKKLGYEDFWDEEVQCKYRIHSEGRQFISYLREVNFCLTCNFR